MFRKIEKNNNQDFRETIVEVAVARGFFSVWMGVFVSDLPMLKLLIEGFRGTSSDCYDSNCLLVPRPNGNL